MKKQRLGLVLLVAGTIIFCSGIGNHLYHEIRMKRAKTAIPKRIFELEKELEILEQDPNSATREYSEVFQEALRYDRKINVTKLVDNANLMVEKYNNLMPYSKGLAGAGLVLGLTGYILKNR